MRLQQHERQGPLATLIAEVFPTQPAVGWLHTHNGVLVVRVEQGVAHTPSGPAELSEVWSARLGLDARELRWELDGDGGAGVVLEMSDEGSPGLEVVMRLEATRVLWGTVADLADGWARLHETRTAPIWVPAPEAAAGGGRLGLETIEVVAETAEQIEPGVSTDGNLTVIEELIVGLTVLTDEEAR